MPINETYRTWIQRICEVRPRQRKTQVQNFVWLVVGIFHSHSVSLSKIAGKVISTAKNVSTVRRISRFLANPAVDVRSWYRSTTKAWLQSQFQQVGEIRLIVDGTKIGFGHQLLMVSLAYRRRAIPIAWFWVRHVRGHSSGTEADPLVEWGNKEVGFYDAFYANIRKLNPDAEEGRLTNQIGEKAGNAYFFTFCQLVCYQRSDGTSFASNSNCGAHLAPR